MPFAKFQPQKNSKWWKNTEKSHDRNKNINYGGEARLKAVYLGEQIQYQTL